MGLHPYELKSLNSCKMEVRVRSPWKAGKDDHVECSCPTKYKDRCTIDYDSEITALVYYFSPRAHYFNSETSFFVDPRGSENTNDDLPFEHAKIDGINMLFDRGGVDGNTILSKGTRNEVKGRPGTYTPNLSSDFELMFDSGAADLFDPTMDMCLPDSSLCYKVRTLPSISCVNATMGYTTGKQSLIITGTGFGTDIWGAYVSIDGA